MSAYLRDNPPKRSQYRTPRRSKPSGVVVVHTAESLLDSVGPDTGAENVARFICGRSNPGSYHDLVDSDSIVNLVDYRDESYHDGTGSNPHSYGVSFALSAADWPRLSPAKRAAFLRNGARAAARYARWVEKTYGVTIPAKRISRSASESRAPGFISHGERDPGRRTDPGASFPWLEFLTMYAAEMRPKPEPEPVPETKTEKRKAPNVFVTRYGRSAFRLVTGDRLVWISPKGAEVLRDAGIPYVALPTEDVQALAKTLVSETPLDAPEPSS